MNDSNLTQLLLGCLQGEGTGACAAVAALPPPERQALARRAVELGVGPILYRTVSRDRAVGAAPDEALSLLHQSYLATATRNMALYRSLHRVLSLLHREGVRVLLLKGAFLAQAVYGNVALRPMGDIDLMVREADLPVVDASLRGLGYVHGAYAAAARHLTYEPPDDGVKVEVHWDLPMRDWPVAVDLEGLWCRARPATVAGFGVLGMAPEDLIPYLCYHLGSDHLFAFYGLRGLLDVTISLRHYGPDLDWARLCERTVEWGVQTAVHLALALAQTKLGAPVPDGVVQGLRPTGLGERVVELAWARALGHRDGTDGPRSGDLGELAVTEGLLGRARVLARSAFPSAGRLAQLYGLPPDTRAIHRYYLVRWLDLIMRNGRRAVLLWRRDQEAKDWMDREAWRTAVETWLTKPPGTATVEAAPSAEVTTPSSR